MRILAIAFALILSSVSWAGGEVSDSEIRASAKFLNSKQAVCPRLLSDFDSSVRLIALQLFLGKSLGRDLENSGAERALADFADYWFDDYELHILKYWNQKNVGERVISKLMGKDLFHSFKDGKTIPQDRDLILSAINNGEALKAVEQRLLAALSPQPLEIGPKMFIVNPADLPAGADNGLRSPRRIDQPGLPNWPKDNTSTISRPEINPRDLPAGADNGLRSPRTRK